MAGEVNAGLWQGLRKAIRERYRTSMKDERLRILDEFVAGAGDHRKHGTRLFNVGPVTEDSIRGPRLTLCDEAVRETLVVLWEAADRVCGKRLAPLLPLLLSALERRGHLTLAATVRALALAARAATLARLLAPARSAVAGQRTRRKAIPTVQPQGCPGVGGAEERLVVQRRVGYRRLEGLAAVEALPRLYAANRRSLDFFQPSFGLASKTRLGAEAHRTYHAPQTPCARLLASATVTDETNGRLRSVTAQLDPLQPREEIGAVQHHSAALASGKTPYLAARAGGNLDRSLTGLAAAWPQGEVRPTRRIAPKLAREWRTQKDPFETPWPRTVAWLEAEPDRIARKLFERFQSEAAGLFPGSCR